MTSMNRTLVIMAKAPRLGAVKTRLAESFPPEAVTELYRCLLNDTIALAQTLHHVKIAMMCPASDVEDLSRVVAKTVPIVAQTGRGLAAGLASVFQHFAIPGHRGVIAFNSDSPHLPASVLEAAFDVVETCDLVVGPTHEVVTILWVRERPIRVCSVRSEEHTSELQSRLHLVCRLLLEK